MWLQVRANLDPNGQHTAVRLWQARTFQLLPPAPRTTPFPEEKTILGVIYGVLLWADMDAATPLGTWGAL